MSEHEHAGPTIFETQVLGTLESIERDTAQLKRILLGDDDPRQGVALRLDRIEQTEASRKWLVRVGVTSGIGAMVASLLTWLKGGN